MGAGKRTPRQWLPFIATALGVSVDVLQEPQRLDQPPLPTLSDFLPDGDPLAPLSAREGRRVGLGQVGDLQKRVHGLRLAMTYWPEATWSGLPCGNFAPLYACTGKAPTPARWGVLSSGRSASWRRSPGGSPVTPDSMGMPSVFTGSASVRRCRRTTGRWPGISLVRWPIN
ncbi:Helix-turn-helix transcriptional regulator OS=Streptomyces rimosus subsp. rimosus (strain ATCC / DSM 40260 / JCM 4667 / NRRL 2234) OX=1265868 GN=SRIM_028990 PE=4 SV=1 [Streptomyces rimosus subsp. rimosus]